MKKIAVLIVCENSAVNMIEPNIAKSIDTLKTVFPGLVKIATYSVEDVPRDFPRKFAKNYTPPGAQ